MILRNNIETQLLAFGSRLISAVYQGTRLIWQSVRSCFGAGYYVNEKPWLDDEAWRNE